MSFSPRSKRHGEAQMLQWMQYKIRYSSEEKKEKK